MSLRETLRADLQRNKDRMSRISVIVFRLNQAAQSRGWIVRKGAAVLDLVWLRMIVGAELPPTVKCGAGLRLAHVGRGVTINPRVRIGSNVTIYHRVTLGVIGSDKDNVPIIGDNVYLGTAATVIGRVSIGDGAKVGAGATVLNDVPPGHTAVGPKATILVAQLD